MLNWFHKQQPLSEAELYEKERAQEEAAAGSFCLTVQDVFSITGRGVVITGRVEAGSVNTGQKLSLTGQHGCREVTVRALELFRKQVDSASAGDNVGILLEGLERGEAAKGDRLTG